MELIESLKELLEKEGIRENLFIANTYKKPFFFNINWIHKAEQAMELKEMLNEDPSEFSALLQAAMSEMQLNNPDHIKNVVFTGFNEKNYEAVKINELDTKHQGKAVIAEGIIKALTIRETIQVTAQYLCHSCGNQFTVLIKEKVYNSKLCKCGSRAYKLNTADQNDVQFKIILEESSSETVPRIIRVLFRGEDSTAHNMIYNQLVIGQSIRLLTVPFIEKKEAQDAKGLLCLKAIGYILLADESERTMVTEEARKKIKALSEQSLVSYWAGRVFRQLYGEDVIKESLIVQMIGNPPMKTGNKKTRGDIHILLIGDAGTSKSTLLKLVNGSCLKSRYASGGSTSGAGITAAVTREDGIGWIVNAGAFPLANKGVLCLDEADKMDSSEIRKLHEGLEQQEITVNKASVHVTLPCQTRLLAAANPKYGNFDDNKELYSQVDFPPTFINRFDLVWIMKDKPDEDRDKRIVLKIIENMNEEVSDDEIILFKQYQALVKDSVVSIDSWVSSSAVKWYNDIRKGMSKPSSKMRINPRAIEAVIRLCTAKARSELHPVVLDDDFNWAVQTYMKSLTTSGIDPVTNIVDMQYVATGTSKAQHSLRDSIIELIDSSENKMLGYSELYALMPGVPCHVVDARIDVLKRKGEIFEPRTNRFAIVK